MKEILESYRTAELRAFIREHNSKVRKVVREELKGIRANILKKRLLDIKGKKRDEIIEIMMKNKNLFKKIQMKKKIPQKDLDFILDKLLQPKLTEAYKNYVRDRDEDELEDAVKEIRTIAKNNGLKSFQTKAKMLKMIIDDAPPLQPKKKAPPKPTQPPKFIYSPRVKALVLRERPKRPERKAPTLEEVRAKKKAEEDKKKAEEDKKKKEAFNPAEVHAMPDGDLMTGKKHNQFSRKLTEAEVERVKKFRKEQKAQKVREAEKAERERKEKEKKAKIKAAFKKIKNPKERAKILRKAQKRIEVVKKKLDVLANIDQNLFTQKEIDNIDDIAVKASANEADEKDQTYLGRLVKKYGGKVPKASEGGKKAAPKKKAPPKKDPRVIKEFNVDKKTAELVLKALPPEEDYNKEDQADLYDTMLDRYIDILLGRDTLEEVKEDEAFDKNEFPLFEYMVKNNLFTDKDDLLKEAREVLKEREAIKAELEDR